MVQKQVFDKEASVALKGIAIIMMLFHHCFRKTVLFEGYPVSFSPFSEKAVVDFAFACKACVSIFAFISGYGLFLSYKKYSSRSSNTECINFAGRWVLGRYIKTFSDYWFVWIVWVAMSQLLDRQVTRVFFSGGIYNGILCSALNFLGLSQIFETPTLNSDWWYMSAAFTFILIIPLVYRCREELTLLLLGIIVFPRVVFSGKDISIFPGWSTAYSFLSPFLLGCLFAQTDAFSIVMKYSRKSHRIIRFSLESMLILLCYKCFYKIAIESFWELHYGLFPLIVILFMVEYIIPIPVLSKALTAIGRRSTTIYLVHGFIRGYYLKDFTYSFTSFLVIVLVLLLISFGVSLVLDYLKKLCKYEAAIEWLLHLLFESDSCCGEESGEKA